MRKALVAAVLGLLAACASPALPPEQQWLRRDATPEDVRRDLYWCSTPTRQRLRVDETGGEITQRRDTVLKVDENCMVGRGYTKAPAKS
jgi:hypothetical protein